MTAPTNPSSRGDSPQPTDKRSGINNSFCTKDGLRISNDGKSAAGRTEGQARGLMGDRLALAEPHDRRSRHRTAGQTEARQREPGQTTLTPSETIRPSRVLPSRNQPVPRVREARAERKIITEETACGHLGSDLNPNRDPTPFCDQAIIMASKIPAAKQKGWLSRQKGGTGGKGNSRKRRPVGRTSDDAGQPQPVPRNRL